MNVLINGASGFLGSVAIRELAQKGHSGVAVSRRPIAALPSNWTWLARDRALSAGTAQCLGIPDIDVVLHLEVKQHVFNPTARDLAEFESVNVGGAQSWLEWCARSDVRRFAYISSIKSVRPAAIGPTREDAVGPNPTPYGASKWAAEQCVRKWVELDRGRGAVVIRPAVIYGPGNTANVSAMLDAIRRRKFFLIGPNTNVKSLVSVCNAAAAIMHLMQRIAPGAVEVYNLTDRESYSVAELDAYIRANLGMSGNSPHLPLFVARSVAVLGDLLQRITGRVFPLNSSRLDALVETTHFSVEKLLLSGFIHPEPTLSALTEMLTTTKPKP